MQVYLYCTYDHSVSGFTMTRVEGDRLVLVNTPETAPPREVLDFFSRDNFTFLWRDFGFAAGQTYQYAGGFLGLRNLQGTLLSEDETRSATANVILLGSVQERDLLRRTALVILGNLAGFQRWFFRLLRVDLNSPGGYAFNGSTFCAWLDKTAVLNELHLRIDPGDSAVQVLHSLGTPLHIASCTHVLEEAMPLLPDAGRKSVILLSGDFSQRYVRNYPLWDMYQNTNAALGG